MLGWFSDARTFASRWNRASRSAILRELVGKHFDGDVATELRVFCSIDFAHPTFADEVEDFVVRELCAGFDWHEQRMLRRRWMASNSVRTELHGSRRNKK